jgi:hypothetical protein
MVPRNGDEVMKKSIAMATVLVALAGVAVGSVSGGVLPATAGHLQPVNERVKPEDRNAAIRYLWGASLIPANFADLYSAVDFDAVGFTVEQAQKSEAFKAACVAINDGSAAGVIMQATRLAKCDFEIDYENGIGTLLPHLGKMRNAARLLRLDARRLAVAGNVEESAKRLEGMVNMATHAAGDGYIISSLVGIAIVMLTTQEVKAMAEAEVLTLTARDRLLDSLRGLDPKDSMRIRAALMNEQTTMIDWMERYFADEEAGARFAAEVGVAEGNGQEAVLLAAVSKLNQKNFQGELKKLRGAYDVLFEAWDKADRAAAITDFDARVQRQEFGMVAGVLAPSLGRLAISSDRLNTNIAETIEALEKARLAPDDQPAAGR